MGDGKYEPLGDATDDLPRTFRRERENRERAAREQAAKDAERTAWDRSSSNSQLPANHPSSYGAPEPANPYEYTGSASAAPVAVNRFKVPFVSLMGFFIKSVFAAIPALLILMAMLYGLGLGLQKYFPELIKMKIVISFPG